MDFWALITTLGNSEAYLFLIPFVYFIISRKIGWRILLLSVLTAVVVHALKDFFKAQRPPKELWKIEAKGYSFPSGHSAGASSFWCYLALKLGNKGMYILSVVIIWLISISRVFLGVHYMHDIIAGIVLGVSLAFMFYFLDIKTEKINEKKKNKSLLIGVVIILFLSPYLIFKIPLIGSALLGFGLAHVSAHFLNLKETKNMKRRIVNFIISASMISLVFILTNPFYAVVTGFLSCLFPQLLWYFIDKRIEKQR